MGLLITRSLAWGSDVVYANEELSQAGFLRVLFVFLVGVLQCVRAWFCSFLNVLHAFVHLPPRCQLSIGCHVCCIYTLLESTKSVNI